MVISEWDKIMVWHLTLYIMQTQDLSAKKNYIYENQPNILDLPNIGQS